MSFKLWFQNWPIVVRKGSAKSGFRGHAGRPGQRGGSAAREMAPTWTDEEISAIHGFSWLMAQTINEQIASGNLSTVRPFGIIMSNAEQVELMDSAISKAQPTRSDTTLYSLFDSADLWEGKTPPKVGRVVRKPGYLSTTTIERGVAAAPGIKYRRETLLKLKVPKGTRGVLPIQNVSQYPQEREHLIYRGAKYRIDKFITPSNPYIDPYIIEATLLT